MKQIELDMKITKNGTVQTEPRKAWLPFDGAEFAATKVVNDEDVWQVSHVRTTYAVPYTLSTTRGAALLVAERLSRDCPSAALVGGSDAEPRGTTGASIGPVEQLAREVKASLGIAA